MKTVLAIVALLLAGCGMPMTEDDARARHDAEKAAWEKQYGKPPRDARIPD